MRYLFITNLLLIILIHSSCRPDSATYKREESISTHFTLKSGDLLFQDSDCGPFCEAIEKVTSGYNGYQFSHIGLVEIKNGKTLVIEAVSAGVVYTPLDSFLSRSFDKDGNSKVVVGRLKQFTPALISKALDFVDAQKGKLYDDVFDITNDKYYCSELIYDAFLFANDSVPIFELQPMTFIDPDTKETFPIWVDYFEQLDTDVPEGKLGINPGGISRSKRISIIHKYGIPSLVGASNKKLIK